MSGPPRSSHRVRALILRKGHFVSITYDCTNDYSAMELFDIIQKAIAETGTLHFSGFNGPQTIPVKFEELDS